MSIMRFGAMILPALLLLGCSKSIEEEYVHTTGRQINFMKDGTVKMGTGEAGNYKLEGDNIIITDLLPFGITVYGTLDGDTIVLRYNDPIGGPKAKTYTKKSK